MTTTFSEFLADFVTGYRPEDVSDEALASARMCIADALAAACSSAARSTGQKAYSLLSSELTATEHPSDRCTVIGNSAKVSAELAAFTNAVLMHAEDYDDTPHTCYYLPALLATAEETSASGMDLITAWVVAYEVWMALVQSLRIDRPFNPTSVVAPIAAAAGICWLKGHDRKTTASALAIATQGSGGIRGHFGTDMKALDAGRSARAGIQATRLAELGWTAELGIFEADNGWTAAFGGRDWSLAQARKTLATPARSFPRMGRGPGTKSWPCCARHVGPLTVILELAKDKNITSPVVAMEIETGFDPEKTAAFRTHPRNGLEAKFSVPFVATAAWLDGDVTAESFDDDSFNRITNNPLYSNISVAYRPEREGAQNDESCLVRLLLADGSERVLEQRGIRFLHAEEVMEKLYKNASRLIGPHQSDQLVTMIAALETAPEASSIHTALVK